MEAATQTTVPTVSADTIPTVSVQPKSEKIKLVPKRVTMVMPEVGLEETPTSPTILDDTVTKKKANIPIHKAPKSLMLKVSAVPSMRGTATIISRIIPTPTSVTKSERSRSVLSFIKTFFCKVDVTSDSPSLNEAIMVGMDFMMVIMPPKATAPAPMYLMYLFHISEVLISAMVFTVSGKNGLSKPSPK